MRPGNAALEKFEAYTLEWNKDLLEEGDRAMLRELIAAADKDAINNPVRPVGSW